MKKLFALVAAGIVSVALIGCGEPKVEEPTTPAPSPTPGATDTTTPGGDTTTPPTGDTTTPPAGDAPKGDEPKADEPKTDEPKAEGTEEKKE